MSDTKLYAILLWLISPLFLLVLGLYIYGYLAVAPYVGFMVSSSGGEIRDVYLQTMSGPSLLAEDVIEWIDGQDWAEYDSDLGRVRFAEYVTGDVIHFQVSRAGRTLEIAWEVPEQAAAASAEQRLVNSWWLAYAFWFCGLLTILLVRPRDTRWLLLVTLYYLLAVWLMTGSISYTRIYGCTLVMRALTWLMVPVALHFHWLFPEPLGAPRPRWKWAGYLLAGGLALAELLQWLPSGLFAYGALLFALGSVALLVAHAVSQPASRRELSLLALVLGLLIFLVIGFMILGQIPGYGNVSAGGILFAPLFPLAYFLVAVRRGVGGVSWRANRAIPALVFGLLLVALALFLIAPVMLFTHSTAARLAAGLVLLPLVSWTSALLYPGFQRWFERRFLHAPLPVERLAAEYAERLSANPNLGSLLSALDQDIFPSLLVRQAALLRLADFDPQGRPRRAQSFYSLGVTPAQQPDGEGLRRLLAQAGQLRQTELKSSRGWPCDWVRLALPLVYEGETIGVCLLGRRDPDDRYDAAEIQLLHTLMHQTALALVHLDQSALLHILHRDTIKYRDMERTRLAHDLHDEVLPQLALLTHYVGDPQAFERAYRTAAARVRQVIDGLSPATLEQFGLHTALEELLGDLDERIRAAGGDEPALSLDIAGEKLRYPPDVELNLFRIVQGACLNALRHAQANHLAIHGRLDTGKIELVICDNGMGFDLPQGMEVSNLVKDRHYGLLTMYQRALLVGADLDIDTAPGEGTRISVSWQARESDPGD